MRIVTTTCSNTEIVCALGCADRLVGVDDHSDWPPEVVARLPRVGPDLTVDPEKVKALHPDLVLASLTVPGHEKVVASLQAAGLRVIAPEPVSLADVYTDIRAIADALGVPERAEPVIAEFSSRMKPEAVAARRPAVLVQWWPKPVIAPGRLSWVHDMIELAGGVNPLGHRDVKSEPLTDAQVAALDPDAIVIAWCGVKFDKYRPDVVYNNPSFASLRAIQNRQVHCISEEHLGRPSPRLADGLRALRAVIEGCGG